MLRLMAAVSALGPQWVQPTYILERFGTAAFVVALLIIFAECGLLLFFLPGDSLLFVTGLFIATGQIVVPLWWACVLLTLAAVAGNVVGYWIGRRVGPGLFDRPDSRLLSPDGIVKTHAFFVRYGPRAIVLGRFVPIVRTFITAMAGVGRMNARGYYGYSTVGGALWVTILTVAGYYLGHLAVVQNNIELIAVSIVALSLVPAVVEWRRARREDVLATSSARP